MPPNDPRRVRRSAAALLAACLALCAPAAQALQQLEVRDGATAEALVSMREPTRIRIADGTITDVVGNIHSGRCGPASAVATAAAPPPPGNASPAAPVNPAGEVVVECHRARGEIYIRPVGDGAKPINLFIASADATYTLLLKRADIPADTIVLHDGAAAARRSDPVPSAAGPVRGLKQLLRALAAPQPGPAWQLETFERPALLWPSAQATLLRRVSGQGLVGELYRLRNLGDGTMALAEPGFDRAQQAVLAVAIEHRMLAPGDSTDVFVLRRERP